MTADEHVTWLKGYVNSCINRMEDDLNAGRKVCEPRPDLLDFAMSLSMLCCFRSRLVREKLFSCVYFHNLRLALLVIQNWERFGK